MTSDEQRKAEGTAGQVPEAIKQAYFDRPEKDSHPSLRKRVAIALKNAKKKRSPHVKLQGADVSEMLVSCNILWLLQQEVRQVIEESGTPYTGLAREIQQALADRALLNRAEQVGVHLQPVVQEQLSTGLPFFSGWLSHPANQPSDGPYPQRPHRTIREALYHALYPIEAVEDDEAVVVGG